MASLRRWLAVVVLSLLAVYEAYGVMAWSEAPRGGEMALCFVLFTASVVVAALGVASRRFWGRALALGIGAAGLLDVVSVIPEGLGDGEVLAFATMPLGLILLLSGRPMRAFFARAVRAELWMKDDWRVRSLGLAITAAVPMVAGLLRYVATSPWWIGADDRAVALGTSAALVGGALVALSGRTAGLLVMFAGACASAGLAFESIFRLSNPLCGPYSYTDGFVLEMAMTSVVPGVVAVFVATVAFAPAMWRFVRRA
jgi:hypothetical protein